MTHRREILDMLAKGQITSEEAERLLAALGNSDEEIPKKRAKYLRVQVEGNDPRRDGAPVRVNIRAPMQLLRAGVRLANLIPSQARSHVNDALHQRGMNVDLSQIVPENVEQILEELGETTIDVNDTVKVRMFCE